MNAIAEWIDLLCVTVEIFGVDRPSVEAGRARFPLRGCTASICRSGCAEDRFEVELVDMSASGAGLASPMEMAGGDRFAMRIAGEALGAREWDMTVVWCSRRDDGVYMIGAKRVAPARSATSLHSISH